MIRIIIDKGVLSHRFGLRMSGHMPNAKFESVVTGIHDEIGDYRNAYALARIVQTALKNAGHMTEVLNTRNAQKDGDIYCDHMHFEKLKVQND